MRRKDPADFPPEDIAVMAQRHSEYVGRPLVPRDDLPSWDHYFFANGTPRSDGKGV